MRMFSVLSFLGMLVLVGCSHHHGVQGNEERSEIPEGVRVGIGGKEVKEGDRVWVLKSDCRMQRRSRGGPSETCVEKKIGEAIVIKVLDHDSAIVKPDANVQMDNTMTVEKKTI